ncbi:type II toxin-antitoxin system Phd/YefM family antitoxin [Streptosporangium saharense]|uniref:Antitoxin n=1 Tax=Streptosporangium saharense TaxID=1706840 RepID=A0A7W7QIP4_9ACTN|nr:type II toxin-antitoxin system Phd/YefM family antitoxin [Streptosporangium saharense]MBB4914268.1 prevent-host-death family protein [Streptosporangium saharense]
METIPISEARDRLPELADRAAREHDHFTLTRNGRPHAVIVSVAEWESLQETLELLADLVEATSAEARGDVTTEEEMAAIMANRLGRASVCATGRATCPDDGPTREPGS